MDQVDYLHDVIITRGLTNKSLSEFRTAFANEDYKRKVYDVVLDRGLTNKSYDSFASEYSLDGVDQVVETPEVEDVEVEEKVSSTIDLTPERYAHLVDIWNKGNRETITDEEKKAFVELQKIDETYDETYDDPEAAWNVAENFKEELKQSREYKLIDDKKTKLANVLEEQYNKMVEKDPRVAAILEGFGALGSRVLGFDAMALTDKIEVSETKKQIEEDLRKELVTKIEPRFLDKIVR